MVEDKGRNSYRQPEIMLSQADVSPRSMPVPAAMQVAIEPIASQDLTTISPAAGAPPATAQAPTSPHESASLFVMPVEGKILKQFGDDVEGKKSEGITIAASSGSTVRAAAGGEVVFVGDQLKSYGNMVIIKHANRRTTTYAHLARSFVSKGDRVAQGDGIGTVGKTGHATTPQLYFALREGTTPEDPLRVMPIATSKLE